MIMDTTVAPQNITFPTDLKLFDAARRKSEQIIDLLYDSELHGKPKSMTCTKISRKNFLNAAKKKTIRGLYKVSGRQLRFLKRNLAYIDRLLEAYLEFSLNYREQKDLMVLHTLYQQQEEMHRTCTHRIEHRIVNIHQPHVRPIVRNKDGAKTEFGAKMQMPLSKGFVFIDHLSWEAFSEGRYLVNSIEKRKERFGRYLKGIDEPDIL